MKGQKFSILPIQHQKQVKGNHLVYLFIDYKSPTISRNLLVKKFGKENIIGVLILQVDTTFSLTAGVLGTWSSVTAVTSHWLDSTGRTCIEMSRPVVGDEILILPLGTAKREGCASFCWGGRKRGVHSRGVFVSAFTDPPNFQRVEKRCSYSQSVAINPSYLAMSSNLKFLFHTTDNETRRMCSGWL